MKKDLVKLILGLITTVSIAIIGFLGIKSMFNIFISAFMFILGTVLSICLVEVIVFAIIFALRKK